MYATKRCLWLSMIPFYTKRICGCHFVFKQPAVNLCNSWLTPPRDWNDMPVPSRPHAITGWFTWNPHDLWATPLWLLVELICLLIQSSFLLANSPSILNDFHICVDYFMLFPHVCWLEFRTPYSWWLNHVNSNFFMVTSWFVDVCFRCICNLVSLFVKSSNVLLVYHGDLTTSQRWHSTIAALHQAKHYWRITQLVLIP